MRKVLSVLTLTLLAAFGVLTGVGLQAQNAQQVNATQYATWRVTVVTAPAASGAGTITVTPGVATTAAGIRLWNTFLNPAGGIFTPIIVGLGSANQETVTPTAVSGCNTDATSPATCSLTATFANTHGPGDIVVSGDAGIQEAINAIGSGQVVIDNGAAATDAIIQAVVVQPNIFLHDVRGLAPAEWTPVGGLTTLAAPTTLTAVTALPSATPVGAFGTGTYYMCIAYVDVLGQEGPCSATFSQAGLATGSFIFSPPAASTGAVGYTIYFSLTSGTYQLAYKVPLFTHQTVIGAAPVSNGVCTLTTVETTTPACAVTNTTYGQTGATATVTAITVNTSPIDPQVTVVSTTSVYVPNVGGRTTYTYAPGGHWGTRGVPATILPFTISAADTTTTPSVIGTVNLKPGFMNVLGKTIEVCGKATTTATAATIVSIQFQWDAFGQNTAGKGVQIGNLSITPATAFATTGVFTFCEQFQTTVQSASVTGGSINTVGGYLNTSGVASAAAGQGAGTDATTGAVASLNLEDEARLNVIYVHTTASDGAALTLQNLTIKTLN